MKKIGRTIRRRRREAKTDYKARLGLLKSGKARIVVRKTNRYIIIQLVESDIAQDRVVTSVSSRLLLGMGWPKELSGSLKSLAAGYLTGMVFGKKLKDREKSILDLGMQRNIKAGRLYAVLKGISETGADVPYSENSLPDETRIADNEKTREIVSKLREKIKNG